MDSIRHLSGSGSHRIGSGETWGRHRPALHLLHAHHLRRTLLHVKMCSLRMSMLMHMLLRHDRLVNKLGLSLHLHLLLSVKLLLLHLLLLLKLLLAGKLAQRGELLLLLTVDPLLGWPLALLTAC